MYNKKKTGKLMQLIRDLKRQNAEEERELEKISRREKFKKDLADIVLDEVWDVLPKEDEA